MCNFARKSWSALRVSFWADEAAVLREQFMVDSTDLQRVDVQVWALTAVCFVFPYGLKPGEFKHPLVCRPPADAVAERGTCW